MRLESRNLPKLPEWVKTHGDKIGRVSLFIKDIETMSQANLDVYKASLDEIVAWLPEFVEGNALELSFLTDRLILNEPNHCEAGVKNLTLSLDGRFYLCPGFMYDDPEKNALTDLDTVLKTHEVPIKNKQLLKLDHAPICENCDAYQCRRCVWLNKKTTLEVNTPSRQQCVMAHLERNASRDLIEPLYVGDLVQIAEIDYLDPFDELMKKKQPKGEKVDEC
ncbi:MAG: CXXX repeat peptide maturase [Planctomycetia bacterium]|nr:CXXX repeat peptide maturase [Planctomycetia bacterium]